MLTVITPASATRLCEVSAVKAQLGITDSAQDAAIGSLIDQASGVISAFLGRVLGREMISQTERLHEGCPFLILERGPVASIASVAFNGETLDAAAYERDGQLLYRLDVGDHRIWWCGKVVVQYAAGWKLPGEDGRDLPLSIEQSCIDLCVRAYNAKGRDPALRSERVLDVIQQSWDTGGGDGFTDGLPNDVHGRLTPFVSLVVT